LIDEQDGAASESSSSREGIVRKFSCQDIRYGSIDFGHWILELRHWTLEFGHWIACAPGDHGDHGTSVSDEIDQKRKVD